MNGHEVRLVGMSRSGNHAIIGWILAQAEGTTCFLNCVQPWENPFSSARPLEDGLCWRASCEAFDLEAERAGRLTPKDRLLYSYEDCFLGTVASPRFEARREEWVGPSERRTDVLVLRDPFNLFASRLRWIRSVGDAGPMTPPRTAVRIWKQHAREVLASRGRLGPDRVCVLYDRWARERSYRAAIARQLGLRFTDAGAERVWGVASGSSFDGRRFDGRAHEMQVLDRWRAFADDAEYLALFDEEIVRLSDRVFGRLPGTEAIIERLAGRRAA